MNISPIIGPLNKVQAPNVAQQQIPAENAGFGQWLQRSLSEVNALQNQSDTAAQKLISGESKDIHGTMIKMQKASIAVELVMQVRNKVVAAYEEIKRMQF